jgi:hypothetical protein
LRIADGTCQPVPWHQEKDKPPNGQKQGEVNQHTKIE